MCISSSSSSSEPSDGATYLSSVAGLKNKNANKLQVYEDLLAHRDSICLPHQKITALPNELRVSHDVELQCHLLMQGKEFMEWREMLPKSENGN